MQKSIKKKINIILTHLIMIVYILVHTQMQT